MHRKEFLRRFVGFPDGGQAGGLGGHGIDGVAGILTQGRNAGADKLHHLVFGDVEPRDSLSQHSEIGTHRSRPEHIGKVMRVKR